MSLRKQVPWNLTVRVTDPRVIPGPVSRLTGAADAASTARWWHLGKPQLTEIAKQAGTGRIVPAIAKVRDHDQIRGSYPILENGHVSGKLVLRPW